MRSAANRQRLAERPAAESLEAEIARIGTLGIDELRALWRAQEKKAAHKALSADLLARMIAYRLQEQRLGKLDVHLRKLLDRLAQSGGEPVRHLKIGTVLVREHSGVLHEAMVVPGGFSYQGKLYPSLSKAAYAITGSVWSGPRFFGLRNSGRQAEAAIDELETKRPVATSRSSVRAKPKGASVITESTFGSKDRS